LRLIDNEALLKVFSINLKHALSALQLYQGTGGMNQDKCQKMVSNLCKKSNSELINAIGHIAVLYRLAKKTGIKLPG